jgi:hypothetical protein
MVRTFFTPLLSKELGRSPTGANCENAQNKGPIRDHAAQEIWRIKDEHAIAFARQRLRAGDPLPVKGGLIPDHVGQHVSHTAVFATGVGGG